jgi:hypothetical protein
MPFILTFAIHYLPLRPCSSATTWRTAGRSDMRLRRSATFGSADRSTPSPSSQPYGVNR